MKKFTLLILITLFLCSSYVFAEFEIALNIPVALNLTLPYAKGTSKMHMKQNKPYPVSYGYIERGTFFNPAVLLQVGGSFNLPYDKGVTSISVLADFGYFMYAYASKFDLKGDFDANYAVTQNIYFHTVNVGILPKINIDLDNRIPFSLGLGFGIKFPFKALRTTTFLNGNKIKENISYQDIRKTYMYPFIPYLKLTFDAYFYVAEKVAVTFGGYLGYNFGMKYDVEKLNREGEGTIPMEITRCSFSSIDIGIAVGVYFGRKRP